MVKIKDKNIIERKVKKRKGNLRILIFLIPKRNVCRSYNAVFE